MSRFEQTPTVTIYARSGRRMFSSEPYVNSDPERIENDRSSAAKRRNNARSMQALRARLAVEKAARDQRRKRA